MVKERKTSSNGLEIIKHYEGLHDGDLIEIGLQPKLCPAGIWTIGWGHALKDIDGSWLRGIEGFKRLQEIYPYYITITQEEADALLEEDLERFEKYVNTIEAVATQNEFDALVSFAYNLGTNALRNSTLLKTIENDYMCDLIRDEFLKWKYAGFKVLPGLLARRKSEALLFCNNELKFFN